MQLREQKVHSLKHRPLPELPPDLLSKRRYVPQHFPKCVGRFIKSNRVNFKNSSLAKITPFRYFRTMNATFTHPFIALSSTRDYAKELAAMKRTAARADKDHDFRLKLLTSNPMHNSKTGKLKKQFQ